MKKYIGLVFILLAAQAFGWYNVQPQVRTRDGKKSKHKSKTEVSNTPADFWWVYYTGVGDLTDYNVSNTMQGGFWARPPTDAIGKFDASDAQQIRIQRWRSNATIGKTGEYPAGSQEYYVYAAGIWVGALKRFAGDTTWYKVVSKGAYNADMGGMYAPELENCGEVGSLAGRGMAISTQIIPSGFTHTGSMVFKQPGMGQEDYQGLWPFADTLINQRREPDVQLNPAEGDIVSQEDTYCVGGDWIPAEDAACMWILDSGPYDVWGMGIRIEQRTYSWNYGYNNSYLYINWKIRNMTNDTLKNVYFGYFMDNDVGSGSSDPSQGSNDDLIGYDTSFIPELKRKIDLGYTYDSDGKEPGWTTPAGYVGCALCETPNNKGMIGFQYWLREGEPGQTIDLERQDSLKYDVLSCTYPGRLAYMTASVPGDMRQLPCSGPIENLLPGQEVDFTVAVIAAYTLGDLKARAINAIKQYQMGYIGFAPPPSPSLSVIPGDKKVYLSWNAYPETYIDGMAKVPTFEGYNVYRSLTGMSDAWTQLANFDVRSESKDTVLVKYTNLSASSKVQISFEGFDPQVKSAVDSVNNTVDPPETAWVFDTLYKAATYKIIFPTEYQITIIDVDSSTSYIYSSDAISLGGKYYCVVDSATGTPYSNNPGYVSGGYIYMNGFYVKIKNGTSIDDPGANLHPMPGDEFTIWTYKSELIGNEAGIQHYYVDEGLQNGKKYYYAVTSYNKAIPEIGLESLESAKSGKTNWAIPMEVPANYEGAKATVVHSKGFGDGLINVEVADPESVTGNTYCISFIGESGITDSMSAKYWKLKNETTGNVLLDSCSYFSLDSLPLFDGVDIKVAKSTEIPAFDLRTGKTGWCDTTSSGEAKPKKKISTYDFERQYNSAADEPYYDYLLIMSAEGSYDDTAHNHAPFIVKNIDLNRNAVFWYSDKPPLDTLSQGDIIYLYPEKPQAFKRYSISLKVLEDSSETAIKPENGDIYNAIMLNRLTTRDTFKITTTAFDTPKKKYVLDNVMVVPNPYKIRPSWDLNKHQHKIWFQGLPSKCTIKVFTVAGLLVKTIEHDEAHYKAMNQRSEECGPGAHVWDLCSVAEKEGEKGTIVANGLYIYLVTTDDGQQKIGKFAIIK